jgi:hypothetical protein
LTTRDQRRSVTGVRDRLLSGRVVKGKHRPKPQPKDLPASSLVKVLLLLVPTVVIGGMYLWPFLTGHSLLPFGYDTPKYVWRANLVADRGLHALLGAAPEGFGVNADRPGYPVIAALARAVLGVTPLRLAFVLAAVMSVSIGLAAGAFAVRSLREPLWAFPIYAVAVGASVNVARTAVGYTDNLMFDAVAVAAAMLVIVIVQGRGGIAAGIVLLAGGTLVHWNFALLFALIVGALAALLLPASYRQWRNGDGLLATPSIRLGILVGGSAAAGAVALAAGPSLPYKVPHLSLRVIARKYTTFITPYRLPILGPVAALGIPALWWPKDQARRRALLLAVLWAGVGVGGIVALRVLHMAVPAYRFLGFALGIPILGAAAIAGLARLTSSRGGWAGVAVAVVLSTAALAFSASLAYDEWSSHDPSMSPEELGQVTMAGRYMETVGGTAPVVFVVSRQSVALVDHIVRSALPGDQITRALIYLGDTKNLLAGQPTLKQDTGSKFNGASLKSWPAVEAALPQQPMILFLSTLNPYVEPPDGFALESGVLVVRGPQPAAPIVPSDLIESPSAPVLVATALAVLLFFAGAGLGWTASLVPTGWLERVAVAPAFGIASLSLVGVAADRLGLRLLGPTGIALWVVAAALGWSPIAVRWIRARRAGDRSEDPRVVRVD